MGKRLSLSDFIEKANQVHNNEYDYSKSVYVNGTTKLVIICSKHGDFLQKPYMHLQGQGCPICAHDKRAQTSLKKYGVAHPFLSDESREKASKTVQHKYGVANVFQDESVKNKIKEHNLAQYGVENPMQRKDVREKVKRTNLIRYGVFCSMQNKAVQEKHKETVRTRYGVEYPTQSIEVRERIRQTNLSKYGVENLRQNHFVADKIKATCIEKYGVPYAIMSNVVREKIESVILNRYGVSNPMQNIDIQNKVKQTVLLRYGADNVMKNPIVKHRYQNAMLDLYGVCHPYQNVKLFGKCLQTKRNSGTFNTSSTEELLYHKLCEVFGKNNLIRQYYSDEYPFFCDFYVISRNMYIELNASWTHGSCWYDAKNVEQRNVWENKAVNSAYYRNAIDVWTRRDVNKRNVARIHNLNYIVFWDNNLIDAQVWFDMGCPSGRDWDCKYSWLRGE